MRVTTTEQKRKEGGFRRNRARGRPRPDHRGRDPDIPVSAVQHPVRLDDGDVADRRLSVRFQIHVRLQPLLVPVLAAAVHRPRPAPGQRTAAGRRGRVPAAARRLHRLHQARHRSAGRPHPDGRWRPQHQWNADSSASARTISSDTEDGPGIKRIKRWKETLPNGVVYYTLDLVDNSFYDNTPAYLVPPNHYFMMGDNRDNSTDSRVLAPGRLCADRQHRRPRRDHLLLGRRRRSGLESLALAVGRALGPVVHDRSMSRKAKNTVAREELEKRIGYTFADKSILDRALTHISAASPKLGRGGSYQRLEFLGDHVLGLAVSDMLYRAFPEGRRRRTVAPARRSGAARELRRRRACDRSWCGAAARQARSPVPAAGGAPRRSPTSARR